jgi:hypothetical protein
VTHFPRRGSRAVEPRASPGRQRRPPDDAAPCLGHLDNAIGIPIVSLNSRDSAQVLARRFPCRPFPLVGRGVSPPR